MHPAAPDPADLTHRADSIAAARHALLGGVLRASDLVEQALGRIEASEPNLQAWVIVDADGARRQAAELDAALRAGREPGALAPAIVGVKDLFDVAGLSTRAGSSLTSDQPAAADAPVVARLRRAGAIILGKTVTTPFACFDPPPTRNPLSADFSPGGSSSGSAAAVAAGHCLAALGSQTGGSIIRPAAYCGICGFKPTFDAVSRQGVVPVSEHLDHVGVLARSAADLAALWPIVEDRQEQSLAAAAPQGAADAQAAPRFGVFEPFFGAASDEVAAAVRRALATLQSAGAKLVPVEPPAQFDQVWAMHRTIMAYELFRYHRQKYGAPQADYTPSVRGLLDEGRAIDEQCYRAALAHRRQFQQTMTDALADFDGWLMPAAGTAAPRPDSTGDPRFNSPWSYAGLPAVTLPCGLAPSNRTGIGLQMVAAAGSDSQLLADAQWCERSLHGVGS